jgi:uncharacterized protein YutD
MLSLSKHEFCEGDRSFDKLRMLGFFDLWVITRVNFAGKWASRTPA